METLNNSHNGLTTNISKLIFGVSVTNIVLDNAFKPGGGFLRGFGYAFLGSVLFGVTTKIASTPFKNKIIKESELNK